MGYGWSVGQASVPGGDGRGGARTGKRGGGRVSEDRVPMEEGEGLRIRLEGSLRIVSATSRVLVIERPRQIRD